MKLAVITCAADGIGRAIATQAKKNGYRVIGVDIKPADDLDILIADLSKPEAVLDAAMKIREQGPVSLLVNNAGINETGYFQATDLTRQHAVIDINLTAPLLLTQNLLVHNAFTDAASLVFISSLSRYVSYPSASVYAGTKDGLASFARSLSVTYPQMHVLTVYPGPTRTDHARRYSPDNSNESKRMTPEDLALRIMRAVDKRQRVLIPGPANWAFAVMGRWFPALAETAMRKALLEKFEKPSGAS